MNDCFSRSENAQRLIKWAIKAQKLSYAKLPTRNFKEREVWLVAIGHGVGSEVYGKLNDFQRPVLVLKKFNNHRFLGVPLTSNQKYSGNFAVKTRFCGICGKAMIDQIRTYDSRRLFKKMGMLDKPTFEIVSRKID